MLFYNTLPSATNKGMKFVLWEVTDDKGNLIYDWGFCEWSGTAWDGVLTPDGFTAAVKFWSNTISPDVLLKEQSKIIRLK